MAKVPEKWTIVQHSGWGYNMDPTFQRAVEMRHVGTKAEQTKVEKAGGILFDTYGEAADFEEKANGISTEEIPFLTVKGKFSDKDIDGLKIYIPVREVVA